MKVYVVMSNDYPDCVFRTSSDADRYCDARNKEDREKHTSGRIFYRWYMFDVREAA